MILKAEVTVGWMLSPSGGIGKAEVTVGWMLSPSEGGPDCLAGD